MSFEDRIDGIHLKFLQNNYNSSESKVQLPSEDTVREIVHYLICQKDDGLLSTTYSIHDLTYEIIKLKKCDVYYARAVLRQMESLGFEYCISDFLSSSLDGTRTHDIVKFAKMRGYVNNNDIENFCKRKAAYAASIEE